MTGCKEKYDSPAKSLMDDITTTPDHSPEHAVDIVEESPDSQKVVICSEETLPQSRYIVTQRVYAKDDSTGLLYPAFVRKLMWGPKVKQINVGSSLDFGKEKQLASENDEEEDEDTHRWSQMRNCWHYYVHFMGWAVKWDRWVQEEYIYEDSAFTISLSKLLSSAYNTVKPKKKGQKMSLLEMAKWMTRTIELEAEHRIAEKEVNTGGHGEEKSDHVASADRKSEKCDEEVYCKTSANRDKLAVDPKDQITTAMLRKQAQLRETGLRMKQKKNLSDQLTLPFTLKKILVEEWEVITQCNMVHNVPCKISVREALGRYLESKLEPLRAEREKGNVSATFSDEGGVVDEGDEMSKQFDKPAGSDRNNAMEDEEGIQGKEWIEMVEGIALFFDQALPVNLLFAEERSQYSLLRNQILAQRRNSVASTTKENGCGVAMNQENENRLPERMSEIYGCEHLLRLFLRLPSVVAESSAISEMESRRIFSRIGDLLRFLQKNQSSLFQSSFRKPLVGELRRVDRKRARGK